MRSQPASRRTYRSFEALVDDIWNATQTGEKLFGLDLPAYPARYGSLGVYFFLRDLEHEAPNIPVAPKVKLSGRSPQLVPKVLNDALGESLFSSQALRTSVFFKALERLRTEAKKKGSLSRYSGARGLLQFAQELAEDDSTETHLDHLVLTIAAPKNWRDMVPLIHPQLSLAPLGWPSIQMTFFRLSLATQELLRKPRLYREVEGMVRLAAWLEDQGEPTTLRALYSAFGGERAETIFEFFGDRPLGVKLNWKRMSSSLSRLKRAAQELNSQGTLSKETEDLSSSARGRFPSSQTTNTALPRVPSMTETSEIVEEQSDSTDLGGLHSAFGGDHVDEILDFLTGRRLGSTLDWPSIDFPFARLKLAAEELVRDQEAYRGVVGMLQLAQWLEEKGEPTDLEQLHSAFAGERADTVAQFFTGRPLNQPLGWPPIDFPLARLKQAAQELVTNPDAYRGMSGMLRLAKWLDESGLATQ